MKSVITKFPTARFATENRIPGPAAVGFCFQDTTSGVDSMATVTRLDSNGRCGFRIRFYCGDRRRELYFPGSGKRAQRRAEIIAQHIDELIKAKANNVLPAAEAVAWANGTEGRLRLSLVSWDLADPVSPKLKSESGCLLGPYLSEYIAGRTDVKESTRINYRQTRRLLVEHFGERMPLKAITAGDAKRWQRSLHSRVVKPASESSPAEVMAPATISKHTKRAKTMFAEAVADRLLTESPFASLKGGDESNAERHRFIDRSTAEKVLDACPDDDWRLIFALSRFAGMRCPSEVTRLTWSDVQFDENRLRIDSPKTGLRFCPIFPELRPILDAAAMDRESDLVMNRRLIRGYAVDANLATQFQRILTRASVKPWPKPFVNLRSTRRTELQENFPDHVINSWLGHSGAVASKHYLQVTDEHWETASQFGSPIRSPITNTSESISYPHDTKKPPENTVFDVSRGLVMGDSMTPTGLEPVLPP